MILKCILIFSLTIVLIETKFSYIDAFNYLDRLGYLNKTKENLSPERIRNTNYLIKQSLKLFQKMHGLKVTGSLNAVTIEKMKMPRCGLPDFQKRFVTVSKWNKKRLRYAVLNQNKELKGKTGRIMAQAFKYWADVSGLSFRRVGSKKKREIAIKFGSICHGDRFPFDGPGGVLGHAFFPSDGRVHFDEDEEFTDKSNSGINLKIVAVHEFGHALGLDHTTDKKAVMYPYYQGYDPNFKLGDDDIKGIQSLYGNK